VSNAGPPASISRTSLRSLFSDPSPRATRPIARWPGSAASAWVFRMVPLYVKAGFAGGCPGAGSAAALGRRPTLRLRRCCFLSGGDRGLQAGDQPRRKIPVGLVGVAMSRLSAGPLLAAGPRFRLHILIGSPPPSRRCNPLASRPLSLTHGERWVGAVSRPAPYGPTSPRRRDRRHSQARPAARILRRFRTGAAPGAVRTRRRPRCEAEAFSSSSW
jgi:hypothetical protein